MLHVLAKASQYIQNAINIFFQNFYRQWKSFHNMKSLIIARAHSECQHSTSDSIDSLGIVHHSMQNNALRQISKYDYVITIEYSYFSS